MGEGLRRARAAALATKTNGHPVPSVLSKQVRIVGNLRIQNDEKNALTILMLGDKEPELATALTPPQARELAQHLLKHAYAIERLGNRIILPGADLLGG